MRYRSYWVKIAKSARLRPEVRDFYEQLRPEGKCRLLVEVNRTARGERPEVSGLLEIVNGRFLVDDEKAGTVVPKAVAA